MHLHTLKVSIFINCRQNWDIAIYLRDTHRFNHHPCSVFNLNSERLLFKFMTKSSHHMLHIIIGSIHCQDRDNSQKFDHNLWKNLMSSLTDHKNGLCLLNCINELQYFVFIFQNCQHLLSNKYTSIDLLLDNLWCLLFLKCHYLDYINSFWKRYWNLINIASMASLL